MSGSRREIWRNILNRFDLELGTPVEWRADRQDSPAHDIVTLLDRPTAPPKLLLSGTIGSGKSTELNRVAEARAKKGDEFVIVLDLFRHFEQVVGDLEALQNVTSWEVCFLAGLALIWTAKERLDYDFPPEQLTQLAQAWTELAREARRLVETGLDRGHIAVLEEVARDRDHLLTDGTQARALLTYGRLLPYCNGSGWFYPHPLLTMHMIRA